MATRLTKRAKLIAEKLGATPKKPRSMSEALKLAKDCATAKFDESVDVSVNLGVDARKSDQAIRGSLVLPEGTGRQMRIAVFAQGANAEAAKKAGADIVGFEDLAETIKAGNMDFDIVIATPDAMRIVGQLGQILGPRGLMPNPKVGTVTADVVKAVNNAKSGQVQYRTDKNGLVHCTIGRVSFTVTALEANLNALLAELRKVKPSSTKGIYLKKITVATTMGPGLIIDQSSLKD